ncbi:copper resistance protein NlpE N-terminal domain-containing protein [Pedobacter caeni]|uniref:NlpE N-terminal domain-containing protein n=1 Tax=Pedobacter caeni TaxID=288992 RepID=A0A1M5BYM1_9SPHI|nr:copper resistance protein NlpE N-terminal domain-containing protein [Pedobacter caeni]SHF47490.1 NlpE N-terminal domain-containing protein [Pedobacter caeni]
MKRNDGLKRLLQGKTDYKKMFKSILFSFFMLLIIITVMALWDAQKSGNNSGNKKIDPPDFIPGKYSGVVPVSENRKLEVCIEFKSDATFNLKEQLIDPAAKRKPDLIVDTGTWTLDLISKEVQLKYTSKTARQTTFSILNKSTIQMHRSSQGRQKTDGSTYNLYKINK